MTYKTYYTPKYLSKKEVEKLIKEGVNEIVMPKSIYELMERKNKNALNRLLLFGVDVKISSKVGRPKKIDERVKNHTVELIKEGWNIREVAKKLGLKKSTIWDNIKDDLEHIKKERLKNLIYEYKELLIKKDKYNEYVQTLFSELEIYVNNDQLENAEKALKEIINYVNLTKKNNPKF